MKGSWWRSYLDQGKDLIISKVITINYSLKLTLSKFLKRKYDYSAEKYIIHAYSIWNIFIVLEYLANLRLSKNKK